MELTAWYVIVPLAFASLLTGLVSSLGTQWGLFRHYWVLFKFLLTIVAIIVLLLKLQPISYLAGTAAETALSSSDLRAVRSSLVAHAGGGLLVLLVATTLGVYKPRGMIPYRWRKEYEDEWTAGIPLWVKVSGIIAIVLVLLRVIMHLTGAGVRG